MTGPCRRALEASGQARLTAAGRTHAQRPSRITTDRTRSRKAFADQTRKLVLIRCSLSVPGLAPVGDHGST